MDELEVFYIDLFVDVIVNLCYSMEGQLLSNVYICRLKYVIKNSEESSEKLGSDFFYMYSLEIDFLDFVDFDVFTFVLSLQQMFLFS